MSGVLLLITGILLLLTVPIGVALGAGSLLTILLEGKFQA